MSTFKPTYDSTSIAVLIGTVGGGVMTSGSPNLGPVGFTPLPGRSSADYFSAADVGRIVMVLGAGAAGSTLVAKILTYTDTQHVVLTVSASTSVSAGVSNTVVFRPVVVGANSVGFTDELTNHNTGKFMARLLDGAFPPVEGQPFLFTSTDPAVGTGTYGTFFGGELAAVTVTNYPGTSGKNDVYAECDCVSYETVMTRRVLQSKAYSSLTMKQIAQDIMTRGLTAEYFTLSSPNGPTPATFSVSDLQYVGEALDGLMSACNTGTDKYFWKTDQWRTVIITLQAAAAAPWSINDTVASDGNVLVDVSNSRTLDKFANQVYTKADKGLGDAIVETTVNSFNGHPLPFYRVTIDLHNKAAVVPTLVINGVPKAVWTAPTDPRNDSTTISMPGGFDWAWPVDSDYLFVPNGVPTGPGIPGGGTAVVTYYVGTPAQRLYTYTSSIDTRSAIQGGSGIHDVVVQIDRPITQAELTAQTEAVAKSYGVASNSFDITTYRGGLKAGQGITTSLTDVGAVGVFLVESVAMSVADGWITWKAKCTIGAILGDWATAMVDALGRPMLGGSGGVSGLSPLQPPVNDLVSTTQSVFLNRYGNLYQFGFSGTFTLPTDFSKTLLVDVFAVLTATGESHLVQRVTDLVTTTSNFTGIVAFLPGSAQTWELRYVQYNTDGVPSLPGHIVTGLAVAAAATVSSTTAREVPSSYSVDPDTRLRSTLIGCTPVLSTSQRPQTVAIYFSEDSGVTYVFTSAQITTTVGEELTFSRVSPLTAETCKVAVAMWPDIDDPSIFIPAASLPTAKALSANFTVAGLSVPSPTLGTNPTPATGAGGSWPYNKKTSDGSQYWSIPSLTISMAGAVASVDTFVITSTFQDLDASHNPIGPEHTYGSALAIDTVGGTFNIGSIDGDYGDDGFSYTRTGNIAYIRWRQYASNRLNQTTAAWADSAASTLQTDAGSGAGYVDILVAAGGALPPGKVLVNRADPTALGKNLHVNSLGVLDSLNSQGSNLLDNPGFEQGTQGWDFADSAQGMTFALDTSASHTAADTHSLKLSALVNTASCQSSQTKPAIPGRSYSLYAWMFAGSGNQLGFQLVAYWFNAAGSLISAGVVDAASNPLSTGWIRHGGVALAPAGTDRVQFAINISCAGGTGNVNVDDAEAYLLTEVSTSGPLYMDIAGGLNVHIASDFVVSGGVLTQNIVDLAKASNFSTEFAKVGGAFVVNALALNKLVAGDALFAGVATFSYLGGGRLTIHSGGIAIVDNYTTPSSTLAIAASGISMSRGTSSVIITPSSVGITNGSFAVSGSGFNVNIDATNGIKMTAGATTVSIKGGLVGAVYISNGVLLAYINAGSFQVSSFSSVALGYLIPNELGIQSAAGQVARVTALGFTVVNNVVPFTGSRLVFDPGTGLNRTVQVLGGVITSWA
jgi:hypothetical protein